MSIYFNQTNLTPGTAFSGGGGGGNTFQNLTISEGGNLDIWNSQNLGTDIRFFLNSNNSTYTYLLAGNTGTNPAIAVSVLDNSGNYDTMVMGSLLLGGRGTPYSIPPTCVLNGNAFTGVSTINGYAPLASAVSGTNVVNYGSQTLDSSGSGIVTLSNAYSSTNFTVTLTQTSGAPTAIPWAKITASNSFEIAGDSNADVSWMTIGK